MAVEIVKPGLETTVQDYPGRLGHLAAGFPPSGPIDHWSFRLANLLVGNDTGAPALECQFMGPSLLFRAPAVVAVTGADMAAMLDASPVELWTSFAVAAGQTLHLGAAKTGARAYVAVAGGFVIEAFMASASTFRRAGVGGNRSSSLAAGDVLKIGDGEGVPGRSVPDDRRPPITTAKECLIEVVAGPHDDWLDAPGRANFVNGPWTLSGKSDRTGFRLEGGPPISFSRSATEKPPENGSDPSNIIDYGYPIGGINLCGQTPIVLVNDSLTMGGFICPYTVPHAAFWKLGQARPGNIIRFREITVEAAQRMRRAINGHVAARLY
jgi:biotin-dependent carboxylase-like uncharacterized protein